MKMGVVSKKRARDRRTASGPDSGWTLVETLAAATIVLILSATVGVVAFRFIERGREAATRNQVALYALALESYYADTGQYPSTAQGLDALWRAPVVAPLPMGWNGPYLQRPVRDNPWGYPFNYRAPGPSGLPYVIATETGDRVIRSAE